MSSDSNSWEGIKYVGTDNILTMNEKDIDKMQKLRSKNQDNIGKAFLQDQKESMSQMTQQCLFHDF